MNITSGNINPHLLIDLGNWSTLNLSGLEMKPDHEKNILKVDLEENS